MAARLAGKRCLITGGASGLGAAMARAFVAEGAQVIVADIDTAAGAALAAELGAAGRFVRLDVTREDSWDTAMAEAGALDVLVNNAGITTLGSIEEVSLAAFRHEFEIDVVGVFLGCKAGVARLKQNGARGGSIINLSSAAGRFGFQLRSPYAAAKWGVVGFTKTLAIELGPEGIRCNAILPGLVDGPRIRAVIRAKADAAGIGENAQTEKAVGTTSLRSFVSQHDIANMALYLASPFGATISGQALAVDADLQVLI